MEASTNLISTSYLSPPLGLSELLCKKDEEYLSLFVRL